MVAVVSRWVTVPLLRNFEAREMLVTPLQLVTLGAYAIREAGLQDA